MSEQPHACIFHPRIRALKVYTIKDTLEGGIFRYGLCPMCARRLAKEHSFKQAISDRLEEMFEKSKRKKERYNG